MSKPSGDELNFIAQLREKVADLGLSPEKLRDHELLRWIRGRNHDVDKAEKMLRKSVAWRKENGMEDLIAWNPPKTVTERWNTVLDAYDSENSPILIAYAGQAKMVDLLNQGLKEDMTKNCLRNIEIALQKAEGKLTLEGYPVTQIVLITDYTGLPISSLLSVDFSSFWINLTKLLEENYPQTLKQIVGMNSGSLMAGLLKLAKPIMSKETASRTLMCGQNPHKFREQHLPNIPADRLCPRFGGTKKCNYDFCCNVEGKQVYTTVTITADEKVEVPVEITKSTTVLYWSFSTKRHRIQFGVKSITNGDYIIPLEPAYSHVDKIERSVYCENPGSYALEFSMDEGEGESDELTYFVTTLGNVI